MKFDTLCSAFCGKQEQQHVEMSFYSTGVVGRSHAAYSLHVRPAALPLQRATAAGSSTCWTWIRQLEWKPTSGSPQMPLGTWPVIVNSEGRTEYRPVAGQAVQ